MKARGTSETRAGSRITSSFGRSRCPIQSSFGASLFQARAHFEPEISPLRIRQVLQEVLSFLKKEAFYRNISIELDIPDDLPVVYSDHGKLQQIFLNLVNNAFQAMNDGGRLLISAREREKGKVSVSLTDDGCGISEEDQKTIFEPFFTTRVSKGGTGLGLSITYGLLRKLKGDISVRSKLGEGTTFTVDLPVTP